MPKVWIVRLATENEKPRVKTPEGEFIDCATNTLAIEFARKDAQKNNGCIEVLTARESWRRLSISTSLTLANRRGAIG